MGRHTQAEVLERFERHEAALAPVYDIAQIFEDPHYAARGAIVTVDDPDLGPTRVADVFPRLLGTPGAVRHLGPRPGADTHDVLSALGLDEARIRRLAEEGAV
jgi:crotonobetainyl-CoA:carnitine CoA-transferase CaiB-like acyl-CoA transferase